MVQISVSEFQRRFSEAQYQAQREPVEITRHGRREFVLISAEHYDWLNTAAKRGIIQRTPLPWSSTRSSGPKWTRALIGSLDLDAVRLGGFLRGERPLTRIASFDAIRPLPQGER
jgi:prevent-host-death family protein